MNTTRATPAADAWARRTERPLTALALAFLATYAVPILVTDLPPGVEAALSAMGVVIWVAFAVDFVVRVTLADRRLAYVRDHGVDLVVIALPLLRPLRALRLVAVLGVLSRRSHGGFRGHPILYVGGAVALVTFVAALAVLDAERRNPEANIVSFPDAMWWSLTTITTVGYGDRYPTTGEGRIVAVMLMLVGIGLLGVITAALASWFVDRFSEVKAAEQRSAGELQEVQEELRLLRHQLDRLLQQQQQPGPLERPS
ncbi:MAG: potassium channel family protein [Actinomycetota bacterium]|nr:potassium channel family protein [Actinomycetota bacterium]